MADQYPDCVKVKCELAFNYTTKWRKYEEKEDGTVSNFVKEMDVVWAAYDVLE
jgi:hypothetical protein